MNNPIINEQVIRMSFRAQKKIALRDERIERIIARVGRRIIDGQRFAHLLDQFAVALGRVTVGAVALIAIATLQILRRRKRGATVAAETGEPAADDGE